MGFIPALNTVRIALEFSLAGEIVVNVIYAGKSTTVVSTDLTNLINVIKLWWTSPAKPHRSTQLALAAIRTREMSAPSSLVEDYIYPSPEPGTYAGEAEANQVALVCSFRTGFSGRSFRGRNYIAGLNTAAVTGNNAGAADAAAFAADYAALATGIASVTGFQHVVASFYTGGLPRATAVLTPVTQYIVNTRVDTQRRRLPKL